MRWTSPLTGLLMIAVVAICADASGQPQRVDPAVQIEGRKLARAMQDLLPFCDEPGVRCYVLPIDGRIFNWHVSVEPPFGISDMAEKAGLPPGDPLALFNAWSDTLNAEIVSLTTRAVRDAGVDPDFNPETDVSVSISARESPRRDIAMDEMNATDRSLSSPRYRASFTGTRRNRQLMHSRGEFFRDAEGPPRGGSLEYAITPDRVAWDYRETISGTIVVRNTGATRIHIDADFARLVRVTSEVGARAASGSGLILVTPSPHVAQRRFLQPGEIVTARFEIGTDPLDGGYFVASGDWHLRIDSFASNVAYDEPAARISVIPDLDQWQGPRILQAIDAASGVVLVREGFVVETISQSDYSLLGATTIESQAPIYELQRPGITPSGDGRLIAFAERRSDFVRVESIFGERPRVDRVPLPLELHGTRNRLTPSHFSPDGLSLYCTAAHAWVRVDLADGRASVAATEGRWSELSPIGSVTVHAPGTNVPARFREGGESFVVSTTALDGSMHRQDEIEGAGDAADTRMGADGAYLCSDRMPVVVYLPYEAGSQRRFVTEAPATFIGESADGLLAAFEWPRRDQHHARATTAIGIYRVSTGERIATIRLWGDRPSVMLDDPARIMSFERVGVASDNESAWYLAEHAVVHDAVSGFPLQTIDLTPR